MLNVTEYDEDDSREEEDEEFTLRHIIFKHDSVPLQVMISILFALGFFGNIITIFKVACNKSLHSPTYCAVACLALADLVCLCMSYVVYYSGVMSYVESFPGTEYYIDVIDAARFVSHHSSALHVVMLFCVRSLVTVNPFKYGLYFAVKKIIIWSTAIWLISLAFVVIAGLISDSILVNLVYTIYILIFICCALCCLHRKKMKALESSWTGNRTVRRKMNIVVLIILIIFLVASVLEAIYDVVMALQEFHVIDDEMEFEIDIAAQGVWFVNFASNPIMYFFLSPKIQSILKCWLNIQACKTKYKWRSVLHLLQLFVA